MTWPDFPAAIGPRSLPIWVWLFALWLHPFVPSQVLGGKWRSPLFSIVTPATRGPEEADHIRGSCSLTYRLAPLSTPLHRRGVILDVHPFAKPDSGGRTRTPIARSNACNAKKVASLLLACLLGFEVFWFCSSVASGCTKQLVFARYQELER